MANIASRSSPDRLSVDLIAFGSRIVDSRHQKEWTQRALAFRSGVRPSRLSKLERGLRMPKLEECLQRASALGLGLEELVLGTAAGGEESSPRGVMEEPPSWQGERANLLRSLNFLLLAFMAARGNLREEDRALLSPIQVGS